MKRDRSLQSTRTAVGRCPFSLLLVMLAVFVSPGCLFHRDRNQDLGAKNIAPGDQPDKVLYQKAVREIDHGRYDVGRLTLQVLINTYPDSEYLAKAKLLTAESYLQARRYFRAHPGRSRVQGLHHFLSRPRPKLRSRVSRRNVPFPLMGSLTAT